MLNKQSRRSLVAWQAQTPAEEFIRPVEWFDAPFASLRACSPLEMLSTTTFAEHEGLPAGQAGKTTITVQWAPLNATEAERKTFDTSHEDMRMGWTGTFEQLAEYLANAAAGGSR